jgi:hypothetical protein
MLLLYRQQIHITLPGNVKAVAVGTDIASVSLIQLILTDRTDQLHCGTPFLLILYHTLFFRFRQIK